MNNEVCRHAVVGWNTEELEDVVWAGGERDLCGCGCGWNMAPLHKLTAFTARGEILRFENTVVALV